MRLIVCVLAVCFLTGCVAGKPVADKKVEVAPVEKPTQESAQTPVKIENQDDGRTVCPTHPMARRIVDEGQELLNRLNAILKEYKNGSNTAPADLAAFKDRMHSWEERMDKLYTDCDQLVGANGVQVFPEIPAALMLMEKTARRMENAATDIELGRTRQASDLLVGAQKAIDKAARVLQRRQ